jgi:hypothetical protein
LAEPAQPAEPIPTLDPSTPAPEGKAPVRKAPKQQRRSASSDHLYRHQLPSLFAVSDDALTLSVPAVQVRDVFSAEERHRFGVPRATEVELPLLSYTF